MPSASSVQATTEQLGKDRVKLTVEVPAEALGPAVEAAYRRWAQEIKVPGFRKGKVPRALIDARVGTEVVREEALREALPDFYRAALEAEGLEAIAPPEVKVITFEPGEPVVFEATVETRPEVVLPDLAAIEVEAPSADVTDADLDEQLDRLRDRFAELDTVGREARRGDFALIDLKGYRHDEPVEGASAPDLLYEIGSQTGPPKLDEELQGARPGAILKFTDTLPAGAGELAGEEISFTVLVKEVKAKKLPALDDDFAKTVGEFETLDELKQDLRERMVVVKKDAVEERIAAEALGAVVAATDLEPPETLVEGEFKHRLEHAEEELRRAGYTLDSYGQQLGLTELEVRRDLRADAARSVKADLILEEVARREEIGVVEEDIGREIALAAARSGREPKELAEQVLREGRLPGLAADIMRRKALDFIVQSVNVVDRPEEDPTRGPEHEPKAGAR